MQQKFSNRMVSMPKSFVREILKISQDSEVISFTGELPHSLLFQVDEIKKATEQVLLVNGKEEIQYCQEKGYYPLRKFIASRYFHRFGIDISPEDILITNCSQQGLDLLGKIFLDKGDNVIIEKPGNLSVIQAFSAYEPKVNTVNLLDDGIDNLELERLLKEINPKFIYTVPNFQNPTGVSHQLEKRVATAELVSKYNTILIEDDTYGELRFIGQDLPLMKQFAFQNTILLGSFSKIVASGFGLGWVVANKEIMEKLVIAKNGVDSYDNFFPQKVLYRFLMKGNFDLEMTKIKEGYQKQRDAMVLALEKYFPKTVEFTRPEGGMFIWVTLPEGISAEKVFEEAARLKVVFVPGGTFYRKALEVNKLRLTYTNFDDATIEEGIKRLGNAIRRVIDASIARRYVFEEFIEDRDLSINSINK